MTTLGRVAQSVQQLATGWTVWGSNPGGGEIFRTCPERPWDHPASCTMGTSSSPGVEAAGAWGRTPTPSSAEVLVRVELYLYSP